MQPIISIIIPVYKAEAYLSKCLDSILAQTYTNLEIILIDDESPDNCGKICDEYARRDPRFHVIHQKNKGAGAARNLGIKMSRGEYIMFIDSDDYISPVMCETLLTTALQDQSDIVICGYTAVDGSGEQEIETLPNQKITGKNAVIQYFQQIPVCFIVIWNKIYKASLLHTTPPIRFPENTIYEDLLFSYKILYIAKQITILNKPLYYYNIFNSQSVMHSSQNDHITYFPQYVRDLQNWTKGTTPDIKNIVDVYLIREFNRWLLFCLASPRKKELSSSIKQVNKEIIHFISNISTNPYADARTRKNYLLMKFRLIFFVKQMEFSLGKKPEA